MIRNGEKAPEFTLPDHEGRERSLSDLLDGEALILYFYPADFTPGCTKEACDLRDLHTQILGAGLKVVGVSPQSPESHQRFREQYSLPFTLLSDERKAVIRAFDVDGPLGIGVRRATFLIDRGGVVRDSVLADLRIGRHLAFVENAVALARERVPAGRKPQGS
ncbi:MAG: peroxiredoxin [Steroidobacteraceae bacterium]|jgi:peroxiredoxin Q/BCP|nr:peroxiredoxin [Steroidobacteraceae bacterium]